MSLEQLPTLQELAEPLRQPNALPENISLSVGIIATTDSKILAGTMRAASDAYSRTIAEAGTNTEILEKGYVDLQHTLGTDHPHLAASREALIEALSEQTNARLELPGLESQRRLYTEVDRDIRHLSRNGWLASTAAGLILGASAVFGLTVSQKAPQAPPTATMSEQAAMNTAKVIAPVAGGILGGSIGLGIGMKQQSKFARRRARSLMRKAGASL